MRIVLFPYRLASASSRGIADALKRNGKNTIRVYPDRSYRPRPDDIIVNWGNAHEPKWGYEKMLNSPAAVALAVNKLETFKALKEAEVRTVPWTQDRSEAMTWPLICERHKLTGHSGAGIRVSSPDTIGSAPLYTKMLLPCDEYRVHVFNGNVIDYAKKVKDVNGEFVNEPNEHIKNKDHGWYFLRDVNPRQSVANIAIDAVEALGLDFGAVDVIRHGRKAYVLEVGTAAGLSPMGIEAYANKIMEYGSIDLRLGWEKEKAAPRFPTIEKQLMERDRADTVLLDNNASDRLNEILLQNLNGGRRALRLNRRAMINNGIREDQV